MQNKIMKLLLAMIAIICTCIAVFFTLTEEVPVLKNSVTAGTVITPDGQHVVRQGSADLTAGASH